VPRVQMGARALAVLCWLYLVGCGTDSPPEAPTLQLPFTSNVDSRVLVNNIQGVSVGTSVGFAFGALNAGNQSLVVQTVTYVGDTEMVLQAFGPPPVATLSFNDELIIGLTCTPPAVATYAGTVFIVSNAVNTPDATVFLSCVGMP